MANLFEYNLGLLDNSIQKEEYSKIFYDKFTSAKKRISEKLDDLDITTKYRYSDYLTWIRFHQILLVEYANFLRSCKLNPNLFKKDYPAELFKGSTDSLKSQFRCLKIYSKYGPTFNMSDKPKEVISNDITVRNGVINLKYVTELGTEIFIPTTFDSYKVLYVHNPYDKKEESKIHRLLDNDELSIVYGLYGFCDEEDIDKKVEDLKKFKQDIPNSRFYEQRKDDYELGTFNMGLIYRPGNNKNRH